MLNFHFCELFEETIQKELSQENDKNKIYKKIDENKNRENLKISGNIEDLRGEIYVLKILEPQARVLIQEQNIDIEDDSIKVFFIRDIIVNVKFDREYGRLLYARIRDGEWLRTHPLPQEDIDSFKTRYLATRQTQKNLTRSFPPENLTNWFTDFKLKLDNTIFETDGWVAYALNNSLNNGMSDKYVNTFRLLLEDISQEKMIQEAIVIKDEDGIQVYQYEKHKIGVLFSKISVNEKEYIVLHNGAHLETQQEHWKESIQHIINNKIPLLTDYESISRASFRSYPKWILSNDELWFAIEKSDEMSNLSLTQEQVTFFKNFTFPYYINGQAGSGKSTLLYYLFANIIFYKDNDEIQGNIIFLTENEQLLDDTKRYVFDLLSRNPEFDGIDRDKFSEYKKDFNSFKNFLLSMLDENDLECFKDEKYLNFSIFKSSYESSTIKESIKKKYSAEEVWFTIITYIYGYDNEQIVTSDNYEDIVPRDSRKISLNRFKGIETHILPFYKKLLEEGYWDKLKIIRYINENINLELKDQYSVIVCDEAQDFCRVELTFILRQSEYLKYDLSQTTQIPIVFAGDPNQTVNPTGFRESEITSLLHRELKEIAQFEYKKDENSYSPNLNYRSTYHVVNLANFIQYYRMKYLNISQTRPQEAKRLDPNTDDHFNLFLDYDDLKANSELKRDLIQKLKYKIFIIPTDSTKKEMYKSRSDLLSSIQDLEIKTSVEAKGAEYKQVVLYGFGEYFLEYFKTLETKSYDDMEENFQISYYFNKLYVAVTRARTELLIIDSKNSKELFWKKLVDHIEIQNHNWQKLKKIQSQTIVYDGDSIKNILESTKEDALENAKEDKKQGEHFQNPARLKVAASQFFRLGYNDEANLCLGLSEEIKNNYKNSAEYYQKANNLENAANAFFKGRYFEDLEIIGTNLKSIEQDLRIILTRFMNNESIIMADIKILAANKTLVYDLIKGLDWRDELINKVTNYLKELQEAEKVKEVLPILKHVGMSKDINLYREMANQYFKLDEYREAINVWEKIDYFNDEKYYIAKVKDYQRKNDNENRVIFLYDLIRFKDFKEQNSIYQEILEIHKQSKYENFSDDYYVIVYKTWIILGNDMNGMINFGKIVEKKLHHYTLEPLYRELVEKDIVSKQTFRYLIERWAKVIANNTQDFEGYLEEMNTIYTQKSKKYNLYYKPFTIEEVQKLPEFPQAMQTKPSEHFSHSTIKNFRQFSHITLEDIGQFNLVLGDNNVGKTSLLEALLFMNDCELYYHNLAFAYIARNNTPLVKYEHSEMSYLIAKGFIFDFVKKGTENQEMCFELKEQRNHWKFIVRRPTVEEVKKELAIENNIDVDDYICIISDDDIKINELSLILKKLNPEDLIKMQLIPFGKGFDRTLAKSYYDNIDKDKKKRQAFLDSMKIFIPNIDRITPDTESGEIDIEEVGLDVVAPLHQYGEGANKLFRILVQITLQKGKKLLIDEIDAGIHYSHFLEFWKIILKVAKENEVQIFATTHNLECLQYFKEVLELEEMQDYQELSRTITLRKLPDNSIKAYTRKFEEFEYELNQEFEIRGGVL